MPVYQCPQCPKSYTTQEILNRHMRVHTGVKPHQCEVCGKKFARKDVLAKHIKCHTGERSYVCDICKRRFLLPGHLTDHKRTHTGEQPFCCDVCGTRFSKSGNRDRHRRNKHPGNPGESTSTVHAQAEPVGVVTTVTQTLASTSQLTTISDVRSPKGSAHVVETRTASSTTTIVAWGSGKSITSVAPSPDSDDDNYNPDNDLWDISINE
ncbi:C2H2-type zinc finger protein [Endozoicomonas lisbonensis]|uniref:DNA-directed RNA polymerase subunit RPC12/RpoP n=1 Tax=Endozoicomonas lisbonensis TaxID=3120522 RepID=A0ABV2SFN5_9GAMM